MPTYAYICRWCAWEALEFYKSLPADCNAPIKCRGCNEHDADRNFAKDAGSSIMIGGASSSSGVNKIAGMAHKVGGQAYYNDVNFKKQEVRTVSDVDKWVNGNNTLGAPVMYERQNRQTGRKEWVPKRDRNGIIQRKGEKLIPLGGGERNFTAERADRLNANGTKEHHDTSKFWDSDGSSAGFRPPISGEPLTE